MARMMDDSGKAIIGPAMQVKVCGIVRVEDAMAACEAGVDALGFNFASEAKRRNRYIAPEDAQRIIEQLPPFVTSVAVCVNERPERLREFLEIVDVVQLHGEEPPEVCAAVRDRCIKAFRLSPDLTDEHMDLYPGRAWLVDAFVRGARGGTGVRCDWVRARRLAGRGRPLILAGGLTPENVGEAVKQVRPYGVDTAGGVECAPGLKDPDKMRRFVLNAKRALLPTG